MWGLFGPSVCLRCFSFAELPWYQQKVAAIIFSSPPTSTYEEVRAAPLCWCLSLPPLHSESERAVFPHLHENLLLCLFQALEFFLKAEEGTTAHFQAWETLNGSFGCIEWTQFCSYLYSVDPNFYSKNLLMLGKTYMAMKDKQKSLFWLSKAKDYPGRTEEDKEVTHGRARQILIGLCLQVYVHFLCLQAHKEAVELLKKLGWSWTWYLLDCSTHGLSVTETPENL